ncbi:MAG: hypothetical protein IKF47_01455 [Bacilli bacterium]|nr:hypothetical protein [Bacilli bacterium]
MKKTRIFIILLLISISIFLVSRFVLDTDYFWHIKAGCEMFKNGVLTHDIFSWFVSGKYWMSHEWLFEIYLYIYKIIFGNYHTIAYVGTSIFLLVFILFIFNKDSFSKNIFYTLFFFVLFATMGLAFIQARPHMISYSFIALTVYLCLDLYNNRDSKKIYFLPLISILWSNMHGGSSNLSYIFCIIFLICGLVSFKFKKIESDKISKKQIYRYLLVSILCMIGICINIHGFKMFIYPYENILDTTMINNINEWQPTTLSVMYHYVYYIYLLFIVMTMLISVKKIKFIDFVLLLFVSYLGIKSVRFWLYSPIVMSFIIFDYVKEIKVSMIPICVLSVLIIFILGVSIYNFRYVNLTNKLNLNDEVIRIIKKEKPNRLFNMYEYGGELIYNDIPVFIDGRADLYGKYNFKDYLDIANLNNDYKKLIDKYDFDYLLINKKASIYNYLRYEDEYSTLYENNNLILYKKTVN